MSKTAIDSVQFLSVLARIFGGLRRTLFKSRRRVVLFSVVTGVSITSIIAWASGFGASIWNFATTQWVSLMALITGPVSFESIGAAAMAILLPLVVGIVGFLIITDM